MTWKPIIVGVDTSPGAVSAAVVGWKLAALGGTACHLVHAIPDGGVPFAAPGDEVLDEMDRAMLSLVRQRLRAALRRKLPAEALDHLTIRFGHPALVLQMEISRHGAELLVLGSKRHTALGRWVTGSTVLDAVRRIEIPVLVTQGAPAELRRVLVAVDASAAAQPTIKAATHFTRLVGGELRAIHAVEPLPRLPDMPLLLPDADVQAQARAHLERVIWPLLRIPKKMKATRLGPAGLALADEVAEWGADVLVVGKRGHGVLDRLLLGSVTEGLLAHLPTSLLVVPVSVPSGARRPKVVRAKRKGHKSLAV